MYNSEPDVLISRSVCWTTGLVLEPLPTGAWAFLAVTVAVVTKTLTFAAAFSAFNNDVIWLIVVSFFFAKVRSRPQSRLLPILERMASSHSACSAAVPWGAWCRIFSACQPAITLWQCALPIAKVLSGAGNKHILAEGATNTLLARVQLEDLCGCL